MSDQEWNKLRTCIADDETDKAAQIAKSCPITHIEMINKNGQSSNS